MAARIVGISFAVEPGRAAYVPLAHAGPDAPEQLPLDEALALLKPWLESETHAKLGQNLKYDIHVLANHGITLRGVAHDTLLQSYVLEAHLGHSLEKLADRHLGRKGLSYEDLCGKGAHQIPFAQVDVARATEYSGEDSEMALQVHQTLWPRLQATPRLAEVYERIEMPAMKILQRIERHGVLIDAAVLAAQSRDLGERMVALEQEAYAIAEQPFNMGSAQADRRDPVRQARPAGEEEDGHRRAQHRRRGAAGAGGRLPAAGAHPGPPQPGQAQGHLHRQAARHGEPAHRPRAHQLRAGRGRDRPPGQQRPQPAEHPDPHARRPARARGLHRAARARDPVGRLQPDRAAHHGPHQRGPGPAARLCRRHRRAPRHRQRGLQRAAGRR